MPSPRGSLRVESTAIVANAQPDALLQHLERDRGLLRATVPDTIAHRFLDDEEQVQGLFNRHGLYDTVLDRKAHVRSLVLRQRVEHMLERRLQILPLEQVRSQPRDEVPDL